jgi:hypothetical protein
MQLTIGSDPEFFVFSNKKRKIVTSFSILGEERDKENKMDLGGGFEMFCDNSLLEATMPYSLDVNQTIENFRELIGRANEVLGQHDCTLLGIASNSFKDEELDSPIAQLVGCSREYCCYTKKACKPPRLDATTLRSGGGHLHLGRTDFETATDPFMLNLATRAATVRAMDRTIGVFDVFLNGNRKASKVRRELYGRAGRHRPTHYGVEYRTSSNEIFTRPEITAFVDQLTRKTVDSVKENPDLYLDDVFSENENVRTAVDIIDNNRVAAATQYLRRTLSVEDFNEARALKKMPFSPILANNW